MADEAKVGFNAEEFQCKDLKAELRQMDIRDTITHQIFGTVVIGRIYIDIMYRPGPYLRGKN